MPDTSPADLASPEVLARARKIKLFLMDVDGTLTAGGVCLISSTAPDESGAASVSEMKIFNAKDGQGLSLANTMGIQTGFITGRRSQSVPRNSRLLLFTWGKRERRKRSRNVSRRPASPTKKWPIWVTICRIYRWRSAPVWLFPWPMEQTS
jgi:hypothetical protein